MLASAALLFLYARGAELAWALGFVALVPWLRTLDRGPAAASALRTLLEAWLMSVALTAAMYGWFGLGMARYLGVHGALGLAVLLVLAPVFQPQVWVFAVVRHVARHGGSRRGKADAPPEHGARPARVLLGAVAGGAAWVATEWAAPKVLGDTLGHGLYPSPLLRQGADVGGAAGLTLLLLLANEAFAAAWAAIAAGSASAASRRQGGVRAIARPLAVAAAVPLVLAAYGAASPTAAPEAAAPPGQSVRMGLVQSNIVDYERLRRERGAGEVVREVLDVHYAMSYDAVERQKAQALLWSETVYPTTFGRPKSEAGAELDREIVGIVNAAGVPLVFGTYDRDADAAGGGEYNAAAFVAPGAGLVGVYRKTRLFPFTEALPGWLDGPWLGPRVRAALPWVGAWRPGDGARVFPLRLADGREVPVLPMICLDDVDPGLAIAGARLGAMLIVTMSNDSWFTEHPQGAQLHLAVAAFRSIETRLPQFRVTSNGYSAVIDARGEVLAGTRMGERTLVVGELPAREPPRTLMVAWGDWVGRAGAAFLLALGALGGWRAWQTRTGALPHGAAPEREAGMATRTAIAAGPLATGATRVPGVPGAAGAAGAAGASALPTRAAVLTPGVRWTAAGLRAFAYGSLAWMAATVLAGEAALASNTLAQIRAFLALVLAPEAAARALLWASRASLSFEVGRLVLAFGRGARRIELAAAEVEAVVAWRVPGPVPGASLRLASGERWRYALAQVDPVALARALAEARAEATAKPAPAPEVTAGTAPVTRAEATAAVPGGAPGTDAHRAGPDASPAWAARHAQAFFAHRGSRFLQHPLTKFVGLPFLLAIPAFHLHQHIAFGGALGEVRLFGLVAFGKGFALWWAAWGIGVVMVAAGLRAVIEGVTLAGALWRPERLLVVRRALERLALAALYLGVPAWLAWRLLDA